MASERIGLHARRYKGGDGGRVTAMKSRVENKWVGGREKRLVNASSSWRAA